MSALHPDTGLRRPAIFLDRDGVINENRADHVTSWAEFALVPGALAGLRALTALGLPLVVVTNQAIVGRGQITAEALNDLHASMRTLLAQHGCPITAVYACPHRPEDGCGCRKPQPGLLFRAAREHNLDLGSSYYVGDALTDIAAGQAAGCTTVVVRTGRGLSQTLREQARSYSGYYVAHNLRDAARCIAHDRAQRMGRDNLFSTMRLALHGVRFV
jgi:D-glycero-D-manno-heptose 1,7-bisphosphate phosphatase